MLSIARLIAAAAALAAAGVLVWVYRAGRRRRQNLRRRQNKRAVLRTMSPLVLTFALTGCGTSAPASADGLRRVVGTDLIGARGATPGDQRKIDRTVVGICAAAVWTMAECATLGEGRE